MKYAPFFFLSLIIAANNFISINAMHNEEEDVLELPRQRSERRSFRLPGYSVELDEHDLDQMNLLVKRGIMYAGASIAVKQFTQAHDPSLSFQGKLTEQVKEIALAIIIAEALIPTYKWTKEKAYRAFLSLPFSYCKKLKDKQETNKQIHEYQAQQLEELQKKSITQEILLKDGKLLKNNWEKLQTLKSEFENEANVEEKNKLQQAYAALKRNHFESLIAHSAYTAMNLNYQPQMREFIAAQMRAHHPSNSINNKEDE